VIRAAVVLCAAALAGIAAAQPLDTWYRDANIEAPGCSASPRQYVTGASAAEAHALQVADYNTRCAAVECYSYAVAKVHRPDGVGEVSAASFGEYRGTNRYADPACSARRATVVSLLPVIIECSSGKVVGVSGACEPAGTDRGRYPPPWTVAGAIFLLAAAAAIAIRRRAPR
jgi:hypothetical protein